MISLVVKNVQRHGLGEPTSASSGLLPRVAIWVGRGPRDWPDSHLCHHDQGGTRVGKQGMGAPQNP